MKQVFVDTSGFYAFIDSDDRLHQKACTLFEKATEESWKLVTTNYIITETHALILSRLGRKLALGYLQGIFDGSTLVERATEKDENNALDLLLVHKDKDYSFCDAISFIIMERLNISEAIAFDSHFYQYRKFIIL